MVQRVNKHSTEGEYTWYRGVNIHGKSGEYTW